MTRAGREKSAPFHDSRAIRLLRALGWRARDAAGFLLGALLTITVLVNVLFMQSGSHPAPMFKGALGQMKPTAVTDKRSASIPLPRPIEPTALAAAKSPSGPRPPGEIINDIQRELARRGYYDGAVDGLYGPKTDAAIRDFEQAAAFKPSAEPNEALLQAIMRAPAKLVKGAAATPAARPMRGDGASSRSAPSKRVVALQRALAEYGYGQVRPSGIVDAETQAAIEKFERERKLPITGQASDLVMRELAAITGRPLE